MITRILRLFISKIFLLTSLTSIMFVSAFHAQAQCPPNVMTSGLRTPLGITQSNQNNLLVSESGTAAVLHSGRISLVEPDGTRRTLLDGLPSAPNDVGDPSGPAGVFMRCDSLLVHSEDKYFPSRVYWIHMEDHLFTCCLRILVKSLPLSNQ